jgi:hypothetical protein
VISICRLTRAVFIFAAAHVLGVYLDENLIHVSEKKFFELFTTSCVGSLPGANWDLPQWLL